MTLPASNIKRRVIRSGLWVLTIRVFSGLLGILQVFILTKLLLPQDFGLFGMASVIMFALMMFSETGFESALIQRNEDIAPYMDAALIVQMVRGFFLGLIMVVVAPLAAWFFHEPKVKILICVMALHPIIMGLKNIGVIVFQKELEFSKLFVLESLVAVISFATGVTVSFFLRNAWGLVALSLAEAVSCVLISYALHPFRPCWKFNQAQVRVLFEYGRWIFGTRIMKFLISQGDSLLIAKFLGSVSLGLYQMANKISQIPVLYVGNPFSRILFPAYSKMQEDLARLRDAWLETIHFKTFLTIPLSGGIFILAPEIVNVILTPQWESAIPVLRVLCVLGVVKTIGDFEGLFRAIGRPKIEAQMTALRLVLIFTAICPLILRFGIMGAAYAVSAGTFVAFAVAVIVACKVLNCGFGRFLATIMRPMIAMLIMIIVLELVRNVFHSTTFLSLALLILTGGFTYIAVTALLDLILKDMKLKKLIMTFRSAIQQKSEKEIPC